MVRPKPRKLTAAVQQRAATAINAMDARGAWVEMGELVFDDQTKFTKPDGIKKEDYYEAFQPEIKKEFTAEEAIVNCIKYGGEGPWDEELSAMMQQRDAWKEER